MWRLSALLLPPTDTPKLPHLQPHKAFAACTCKGHSVQRRQRPAGAPSLAGGGCCLPHELGIVCYKEAHGRRLQTGREGKVVASSI